jgi:hypothetical protein
MMRPATWILFALAATPSFAADKEKEGGKDVSVEEFLQNLSTIQGVMSRRDPFAEYPPPFSPDQTPTTNDDAGAPNMSAPILERYPLADYEVVAVLLGDKYPRALVRLPAAGGPRKVVIVKENDKIGNRKGVVTKIVAEGLIVQQVQRARDGFVDKSEILLKVGAFSSDSRRAGAAGQAGGAK